MADIRKLTEDDIFNLAKEYAPGLEPLVMAISKLEGGHGKAGYDVNSSGVTSPMQIMSKELGGKYPVFETYAAPGKTDPRNPEHGTIAGIRYLADLHKNHYDKYGLGGVASAYFSGSPTKADGVKDANGTSVSKYKQIVEQNYQEGIRKYGELGEKEGSDGWVKRQIVEDINQTQKAGNPLSVQQLRTAQAFGVAVPNTTDELSRQYSTARESGKAPNLEALDIVKTNQQSPELAPWPIAADGSRTEGSGGETVISSTDKKSDPQADYVRKADDALGKANGDNAPVREGATAALRRFTDLQDEVARRRTADDFLMSRAGFDMDKEKNGWFGATMRNLGMWGIDEDIRRPKEDRELRQLGELAGVTGKVGKDVTDINYAGVTPAIQIAQIGGRDADRELDRKVKESQLEINRMNAESQIELRKAQVDAQAEKNAANAQTEEALKNSYDVLGVSPEVRASAKQLLSGNPKVAQMILSIGSSGKIGDTLDMSVDYANMPNLPLGEGKRTLIKGLSDPVKKALFDPSNKEASAYLQQNKIERNPMLPETLKAKEAFERQTLNFVYDSMARGSVPTWARDAKAKILNPYLVAPQDFTSTLSAVNNNLVGKKIDGKPVQTYTPALSVDEYLAKNTTKSAVDLANDFKLFAEANFNLKGYSSIGLKNPEGFFVTHPTGGSSGQLYNLADPAQLAGYYQVVKQAQAAKAANQGQAAKPPQSGFFESMRDSMVGMFK